MYSPHTKYVPSTKLVVPHFVFSMTSWLLVCIFLFFNADIFIKHYLSAEMLAVTHAVVLGCVTMIVMGALYQLLPVILSCGLYSEKLGKLTFILIALGTICLSLSFLYGERSFYFITGALLSSLSLILFTLNVVITAIQSTEKTVIKYMMLNAFFWLFTTAILGLVLSIHLVHPYLHFSHVELLKIHANTGVIGWLILLIMGVSSVLIPMFLLVHKPNLQPLKIGFICINLALLTFIINKATQLPYVFEIVYLTLGISGLIGFLFFIFTIYKHRGRKKLDAPLKKSILAYVMLLILLIISLIQYIFIHKEITSLNYISLLLIVFVVTLIQGQLYKTLPFIVWLSKYKPYVGKYKIPLPNELFSGHFLQLHYFAQLGAITLLLALSFMTHPTMIAMKIALALLTFSALFSFLNTLKITFHTIRLTEIKK
jgi:hypothetical protein